MTNVNNELSSSISYNLIYVSGHRNLFDKSTSIDNKAWNGHSDYDAVGYFLSDWIPVVPGSVVVASKNGTPIETAFLHLCNSDKTEYKRITYWNGTYTIPQSISLIRVCINKAVCNANNYKLEYSSISEYTPFLDLGDIPVIDNRVLRTYEYGPITSTSQMMNLADALSNRMYNIGVSADDRMSDMPGVSNGGLLITFNSSASKDNCTQFWVSSLGEYYLRRKYGSNNSYQSWIQITPIDYVQKSLQILVNNKNLFNVDTITEDVAYQPSTDSNYSAPGYALSDFIPVVPGMTLYGSVNGIHKQVSFIYPFTAGKRPLGQSLYNDSYVVPDDVYFIKICDDKESMLSHYQIEYSSITPYKHYSDVNERNSLDNLHFIFDSFGVIGDSLAVGAEQDPFNDNQWTFPVNGRWGNYIHLTTGKTVRYFAAGGVSTRTWFQTPGCYDECIVPSNFCQVYLIGLGENDYYKLGDDYLGSIDDINDTDPSLNADTYYGNYAKIIHVIKSNVPDAKIFVMTNPTGIDGTSTKENFNQAVRAIANRYKNVYLIDLARNYYKEYNSGFIAESRVGGHYDASAYMYMGKIITEAMCTCIINNASEFYGSQFIPTSNS